MDRTTLSGAAALTMALLLAGCANTPAGPGGKAPLQLMGGTAVNCPNVAGAQPYCNVRVGLYVSGNLCTATVLDSPAIYLNTVNSSIDHKRHIVWQLIPPSGLSGYTFTFLPANGVAVTAQSALYPQLYGLAPGDGMGNNSLAFYNGYNKQNHVDSPAGSSYLPVVMMTDASGNQSLCAALDPKIVNSP